MGSLHYGAQRVRLELEDRTLAHLQTVITSKLRRQEGFMLSWTQSVGTGSGHQSVWIHPATDLHFQYSGNRMPAIDRDLLDKLGNALQTNAGLDLDGLMEWTR